MELYVDIKKYLPEFTLNIKFEGSKETIGILGASGSGKSMTLKCISGLITPDQGTIIVKDKILFDSKKKINIHPKNRKIGFLFQNYALFPHISVYGNILFGLSGLLGLSNLERKSKVLKVLDKYHLKGLENRLPSQISGGQQQRTALARALIMEPDIVLLDEPFSALDEHLRTHIVNDMIQSLENFDGSAIFVTHNIEDAYRMCENLMILSNGMIDSFGLKQKIFENPRTLETAKLTNCKNIEEAVRIKKDLIEIPKWRLTLKHHCNVDCNNGFVCIRANNIELYDGISILKDNVFPIWITGKTETPFRQTIYLKFIDDVNNLENHHLEWEISKELWEKIKNIKKQIFIVLPPEKVIYVPRN